MTPVQIIFLVAAVITILAAVMAVSARNLVHGALWFILALFGVSIAFVLLEVGFFAVIQFIVYIGAIAILIIFAIMLTRKELRDDRQQLNRFWGFSLLASLFVFIGLIFVFMDQVGVVAVVPQSYPTDDMVPALGRALVDPDAYALPFEISSILLLVAMIGSIFVAREQK